MAGAAGARGARRRPRARPTGYLEAQVTAAARRAAGRAPARSSRCRRARASRVAARARRGARSARSGAVLRAARPAARRASPSIASARTTAAEAMRETLVRARAAGGRAVEVRGGLRPRRGADAPRRSRADARAPSWASSSGGTPVPGGLRGRARDRCATAGAGTDALEEGRDLLEDALPRARATARRWCVPAGGARAPAASTRLRRAAGAAAAAWRAVRIDRGPVPGSGAAARARGPGGPLRDADLAEDDARTLARALEDAGHAEARVEAEVPEGGGDLPVRLPRAARARARWCASVARGRSPEAPPARAARRELRLRAGEPYRVRDVARDRAALLAAYRNAGYLAGGGDARDRPVARTAEAQVVLRRGARAPRTASTTWWSPASSSTREEVVRRELGCAEGEPLGLQTASSRASAGWPRSASSSA